ncbi:MAG TPA: tetratricopeptide repeat protein, partial [Myxococcaceae bacterium]|nr:tetratricopeptide repeat protein [Myxococcaceae bacterium]
MSRAFLCALLAVGGAAGAETEPVPETLKKLRTIEVATLKGQADNLRLSFQDAARGNPRDVFVRIEIAWCQIPAEEAWNELKGIATVNPENPWVHLGMGRIYGRWKMKDQADASFKMALKYNPHFYPAIAALGDLARAAGKLPEADQLYRDALAIQDDGAARGGLGLTLVAAGRADDAKKELDRAFALWPDQPEVLTALGRLSRDAKDLKAAERYATRLTELAPKEASAHKMLGDMRFELGEKKEAAPEYERALRMGNPDADLLRRLAGIYQELGNADGEEHALHQLASLQKDAVDPELRLAELAEARGSLEEAEGQLLEAVQRAPTRPDLRLKLARVQVKREELRDARESYLAASAGDGSTPPEVQPELEALTAQLKLPKKPAKGSVDQIYGMVSANLNALYEERLKSKPELGGMLKVRTKIDDQGKAVEVELAQDTVGD